MLLGEYLGSENSFYCVDVDSFVCGFFSFRLQEFLSVGWMGWRQVKWISDE